MKIANNYSSADICKSCSAKCEKYLKENRVSYKPQRMKYSNKMPSNILATSCKFYDITRLNIETVVVTDGNVADGNFLERDLE